MNLESRIKRLGAAMIAAYSKGQRDRAALFMRKQRAAILARPTCDVVAMEKKLGLANA